MIDLQSICQIQPDSRANHLKARRKTSNASFTAIDLFAGCGGMSLGLKNAGFDIVHANEINKDAAKTYRANFPEVNLHEGDIRSINLLKLKKKIGKREIDLIVAGPPCQGFSVAGKRDPKDPRNRMYNYAIEYVKIFIPKIVVIENVVGMVLAQDGKVIYNIKKSLSNLGYSVYSRILSASEYGVPQRRNRIFIIASKLPIPEDKLFNSSRKSKMVSVADAISDLEYLDVNQRSIKYELPAKTKYQSTMRKNSTSLYNHESPNHSKRIQTRFSSVPIGKNGGYGSISGTSKHTYYKFDPAKLSRTLTTLPEDFIHYRKNRIPTVRELARIQSFPDDFIFLGPRTTGGKQRKECCPQYTQVGNAVPPLMAEAVFKNIARILNEKINKIKTIQNL